MKQLKRIFGTAEKNNAKNDQEKLAIEKKAQKKKIDEKKASLAHTKPHGKKSTPPHQGTHAKPVDKKPKEAHHKHLKPRIKWHAATHSAHTKVKSKNKSFPQNPLDEKQMQRAKERLQDKYKVPAWAANNFQLLVDRNHKNNSVREEINAKKNEVLQKKQPTVTGIELHETGDLVYPFAKGKSLIPKIKTPPEEKDNHPKKVKPSAKSKDKIASFPDVKKKDKADEKGKASANEISDEDENELECNYFPIDYIADELLMDTDTDSDSDSDPEIETGAGQNYMLLDFLDILDTSSLSTESTRTRSTDDVHWNQWEPLEALREKDNTIFTDDSIVTNTVHSILESLPNNEDKIPGGLIKKKRPALSIHFNNNVYGQFISNSRNKETFEEQLSFAARKRPRRRGHKKGAQPKKGLPLVD